MLNKIQIPKLLAARSTPLRLWFNKMTSPCSIDRENWLRKIGEMSTREKQLFGKLATPKRQVPGVSWLPMLFSLCLIGCHLSPDQRNATGPNGSAPGAGTPIPKEVTSPPKVVLIGDSVMGGYAPTVQRELAGIAQIKGFSRTTSRFVLEHLDEVIATEPDIIHLNCGLHDLIILTNTGSAQISFDEYKSNLANIFQRLLKETHAKIIWTTTTPVNEQNQVNPRPKGYGRIVRREADVKRYNRASVEIAKRFGLKCDDLFEVMTRAGRDKYIKNDGVHYNEAGNELLGQEVTKVIRSSLKHRAKRK